jgi:KUP system potassium uptake protein
VIGAISLIVWSLIVVVSLKYSIFILMADNHGEGDWSNKSSWLSD